MRTYVAIQIFIVLIFSTMISCTTTEEYWKNRAILMKKDRRHALGSSLKLTKEEQKVNGILMNYKLREFDEGFQNPESFLAAKHFFEAKEGIEQSKVFKLIKKIPKGASLHSHDLALASNEFLYNLTFRDNLYSCVVNGELKLHFFSADKVNKFCNWSLVNDMRKQDPNFDNFLRSKLTLICDNPSEKYRDLRTVWKSFTNIFLAIENLIAYYPVWQDYFYQALKELHEDNVKYLEFRGYIPEVYDLNGHTYDAVEVVKMYHDTLDKFKRDYPDFIGAKFIYAPHRSATNNTMQQYIYTFRRIKKRFPDFVAGFDLVGEEDLGEPLSSFVPQLLELKSNYGANFFFHAGETNWYDESTDLNLLDAILLNTTRIGHGFAALKHPLLLREIKEREIAIEICPISNQVLKLVDDLRNHPGSIMIANNDPIVIAPDDPSFWGAKGLSYDWYLAFMGMSGRESDLRFLKQLAINSIRYSSMEDHEKSEALEKWENDWSIFVKEQLSNHCSANNEAIGV
ncbi:unnamed protein product [Phaedon cochleariae]|uniref:Adenosine deaminase n=1 Tax=Phaedon cochleariae TaxID=80249 RepID=A0A9P0GPW8_PHACE|nr:unnamed protein product [Phaedon cochleariae]